MKITQFIKVVILLIGMLPFFANHAANYESFSFTNFEKPIKGFSPYFEKFRVKVVEGSGVYNAENQVIGLAVGSKIEVPYDEIKTYYKDQDVDENIDFEDYQIKWYILEAPNWNAVENWSQIDTKTAIDEQYIDPDTFTLTVPLDAFEKQLGLVVVPESKTGLPRMGNPLYLWDLAYYFEQSGPTEPGFPQENPGEDANPNPPVKPTDPDAGTPENGSDPGEPGEPNPDFPNNGTVLSARPSVDVTTMRVDGQWDVDQRLTFTYEFDANILGNEWQNVSATCWSVNGEAMKDLVEETCVAADYETRPEDDPALVEINTPRPDLGVKTYTSLSPRIINAQMGSVLDIAISPRRYDIALDDTAIGIPKELNILDNPGTINPPPDILVPSVVPGTIAINGIQQAGQAKLNFTFEIESGYPAEFFYTWELLDSAGNVTEIWQQGTVRDINTQARTNPLAMVQAEKYLQQADSGKYMKITIHPEDIFGFDGTAISYSTLEEGLGPISDNKPTITNLRITSNSSWAFPGNLSFTGTFNSSSVSTTSASTYTLLQIPGSSTLRIGTATQTAGLLSIPDYALTSNDVGTMIQITITPINTLGTGTDPKTGFKLTGTGVNRDTTQEGNSNILLAPSVANIRLADDTKTYLAGDKVSFFYTYQASTSSNTTDASMFGTHTNSGQVQFNDQISQSGRFEITATEAMFDTQHVVGVQARDGAGLIGNTDWLFFTLKKSRSETVLSNITFPSTIPNRGNISVTYNYSQPTPLTGDRVRADYTYWKASPIGATIDGSPPVGWVIQVNRIQHRTGTVTADLGQPVQIPVSANDENTSLEVRLTPIDASNTVMGSMIQNCSGANNCMMDEKYTVPYSLAPQITNVVINKQPIAIGNAITGTYTYTKSGNTTASNYDRSAFFWKVTNNGVLDTQNSKVDFQIQAATSIPKFTFNANHVGKVVILEIQPIDNFTIRGLQSTHAITP